MPAIYNSLNMDQHLSKNVAWRVSFVIPGIVIVCVAIALLTLCQDTPTGKWADRHQAAENNLRQHGVEGAVVSVPGSLTSDIDAKNAGAESPQGEILDEEKKLDNTRGTFGNHEAQMGEQQMLDTARGEVVQKPSFGEMIKVICSGSVLVTGACYFCTFGAELSINSILGNYYLKNFPHLGLQGSGNWAAMFGLMNVVFRPLGGIVSDYAYRSTKTLWAKKILLHSYSIMMGVFLIIVGVTNSHNQSTLVGLISGGVAFFLEGANGFNYSLVPHVHPQANGIVSGFTGAMGNFGGIIFAIIFRYNGTNYAKTFWIIGVITIGINLAVSWIRPVPKGQIGGR